MTFASVFNMAAKEIMLAMNSEALSLGYCSLKKEQKDIILDPQPTQMEGDTILCIDVLTDITTLTEIINLNCIPSVQVHDTAVTRPLRLALGSATPD